MKIRQFCLQAKVHSLLFTGNLTGELSTEFKYFTTTQTSSCVSILVPRTTPAKSCCFMAGKRIAFTIFSPRIILLHCHLQSSLLLCISLQPTSPQLWTTLPLQYSVCRVWLLLQLKIFQVPQIHLILKPLRSVHRFFYNYCSQSVAHQFSFKDFLKKFGAIAMVSFSMQVVWIYLSQRRGEDRDTNTTFYLSFGSKVKFSSRVHLLNWIAKKALRTENRIMLTSGSFEKRSPKRVALIINI